MPIYEYKCNECNNKKDIITKHEDRPRFITCGLCDGNMTLVLPKTSFILKGAGWASDGYSKKE